MGGMEEAKAVSFEDKGRSKWWLIGALIALVIIGVVLGTIVVIKMVSNNSDDVPETELAEEVIVQNEATADALKINNRYGQDFDYFYSDAISDYEELLTQGDDRYKFIVSCYYAKFVKERGNDFNGAIAVMDEAKEYVNTKDQNMVLLYYVTLRDLYEYADEELYNYYNDKVIELSTIKEVNDVGVPVSE